MNRGGCRGHPLPSACHLEGFDQHQRGRGQAPLGVGGFLPRWRGQGKKGPTKDATEQRKGADILKTQGKGSV